MNEEITSKSAASPLDLEDALQQPDANFQKVSGEVRFLDGDLVRIFNRSMNGTAGEHVVSVAETASGQIIFVNRGFVPMGTTDLVDLPDSIVTVEGWLRESVEKDFFGVSDTRKGRLLPRFNIEAIKLRYPTDAQVAPLWLQLENYTGFDTSGLPLLVGLPETSEGSHKSYAVQWMIFAFLVGLFYVAILRRSANRQSYTSSIAPE